jgi:hypothetical protein
MLRSCGLEMAIARSPYIIVGLISGFSSLLPSHSHSMRAYSDEFVRISVENNTNTGKQISLEVRYQVKSRHDTVGLFISDTAYSPGGSPDSQLERLDASRGERRRRGYQAKAALPHG